MKPFAADDCPYGKRLPEAVYLFRPKESQVSDAMWHTIRRAEVAAKPSTNWNLLKVHTKECALTFLSYPGFDAEPHPALVQATKINLKTGSVTQTDYSKRANPPILHRKETFLPPEDSRAGEFAALTRAEEAAGLYREPSTIGLQVQWTNLLRRLGYSYSGHTLAKAERSIEPSDAETAPIARQRTAIKRYDLSRPMKQVLERGLLRRADSFFDFGCGHGMDVEALRTLGYHAQGWDPAFQPSAPKVISDVVNLGFVLNVIEEPSERIQALKEAFGLESMTHAERVARWKARLVEDQKALPLFDTRTPEALHASKAECRACDEARIELGLATPAQVHEENAAVKINPLTAQRIIRYEKYDT